jgi:predicted dehydrogenase
MSGVTLVGVADTRRDRAEEVAGRHGVEAFSDCRALLGKVDVVSVATPTASHREVASAFLREKVAVLVEKPMAASLPEADDLIALAGRNGVVLGVGHTERFNPAVRALRERVKDPRFIEVHRLGTFPARSLDVDVVLDLMIHDIDLILDLTSGATVKALDATGVAALTPRVDIANARIQLAGGCVANLTASRISDTKVRKVRVFTRNTYFSCDCADQSLEQITLGAASEPGGTPTIVKETPPVEPDEPLAAELRAFIGAARGGPRFEVGGEEGRRALALALAVAERLEEAQREGSR